VSAYLLPCVAGEMRRHLRDHGWAVHVPRPLQEAALRVSRGADDLTARLGRAPTVSELSAALGMSEEEVVEGLSAGQAYRAGSLDAPSPGDGSDGALSDRLGGDDAGLEWAEGRTLLHQLRGRLDQRERLVLSLRFDADLTQLEISRRVGCSQMQVSRVLRRALAKIRAEAALA
jgi:RNA polymerase sigma-B factor